MDFLNQKPCISSRPGIFQFDIFLVTSKSILALGPSSRSSNSLVILFIHSAFLLCLWMPYFSPKSFGFSCIRLLVCFRVNFSQLLIEFSFFVLECAVLFVLFYSLSICLFIPFSPVLTILFPQVVLQFFFLCCLFLFVPTHSRVFPLFCHIGLFCRCFICVSSRISHSSFDFAFVLFERIPIFSQTNIVST